VQFLTRAAGLAPDRPARGDPSCIWRMARPAPAALAMAIFSRAARRSATWAAAMATWPLIIHPGFDPAAILASIEADRVETLSLVPARWAMLVDHPAAAADLSSLRRALYGVSPMAGGFCGGSRRGCPAPPLPRAMARPRRRASSRCSAPRIMIPMAPTPVASARPAGRSPFSSCGCWTRGTVGEVAVRGTGTMIGYWNRPEETAAALRDGWLMRGDAGYLDADG
jgi:acyl-CoA synthetase (AMP-forming)/AMP-acid ligase II